MKKRDLTIVWIALIGIVFWLVTVRPAPIRKPLRKAQLFIERIVGVKEPSRSKAGKVRARAKRKVPDESSAGEPVP
jgi:hypothetical protein